MDVFARRIAQTDIGSIKVDRPGTIGVCTELSRNEGDQVFVFAGNPWDGEAAGRANEQPPIRVNMDCIDIFSAGGQANIRYSYKTNCVPGILSLIHAQAIGAEVISPCELWLALRLGMPGDRIIFNGPHKTEQSLKMAVDNQVKLINLDSLSDIHRLLKVCKATNSVANAGIRLCPTSGWRAQFGLDMDNGEAAEGLKLLADNSELASLKGVHLHLGSQVTDLSIYARVITDALMFLHRSDPVLFSAIEYIDAGGGFGVATVREIGGLERKLCGLMGLPFAPPKPADSPLMEQFITTISEAIQSVAGVTGIGASSLPTAIIEPGRSLTSNSQLLPYIPRILFGAFPDYFDFIF